LVLLLSLFECDWPCNLRSESLDLFLLRCPVRVCWYERREPCGRFCDSVEPREAGGAGQVGRQPFLCRDLVFRGLGLLSELAQVLLKIGPGSVFLSDGHGFRLELAQCWRCRRANVRGESSNADRDCIDPFQASARECRRLGESTDLGKLGPPLSNLRRYAHGQELTMVPGRPSRPLRAESDELLRSNLRLHQLTDGIEHDAELGVVFLLESGELAGEIGVALKHLP
jgi:hypothetical protein